MSAEDFIRSFPGGVREAVKTESGRRALAEVQRKYARDIIQPSDPRFHSVWGHKVEERKRVEEKKVKEAREARMEHEEKRKWKSKNIQMLTKR